MAARKRKVFAKNAPKAPPRYRRKFKKVPVPEPIAHDEEWVTKTGAKIPVWSMTEDHVRNALRMVIRAHRQMLARNMETAEDRFARRVVERLPSVFQDGDSMARALFDNISGDGE